MIALLYFLLFAVAVVALYAFGALFTIALYAWRFSRQRELDAFAVLLATMAGFYWPLILFLAIEEKFKRWIHFS